MCSFTSKYVAVIVARLQDGQQRNFGSIPNRGKRYLSSLHPPASLIFNGYRATSLGVKWLVCEADY